ncbi:hypothetical protein B0J17DRAFT_333458 [Rhizoctonia solani]|nr:hypothetical protein B0J17DRAFT_333458 [Rhizoctonia solani]
MSRDQLFSHLHNAVTSQRIITEIHANIVSWLVDQKHLPAMSCILRCGHKISIVLRIRPYSRERACTRGYITGVYRPRNTIDSATPVSLSGSLVATLQRSILPNRPCLSQIQSTKPKLVNDYYESQAVTMRWWLIALQVPAAHTVSPSQSFYRCVSRFVHS